MENWIRSNRFFNVHVCCKELNRCLHHFDETVFNVTEKHHRYLSNREEREEGGSPGLLSDARLALAMLIPQQVATASGGWTAIHRREQDISAFVYRELSAEPDVLLLGKHGQAHMQHQLPVFSFLIRCADRFLHFHYVSVLLNDLFGIQARGGCMCAGPFSHTLLGLSSADSSRIEAALLDKHELLRPGYTRLSFAYWMPQIDVEYIVNAVKFVARHGVRFLPLYRCNPKTGEWAHSTRLTRFPERKWLSHYSPFAANATVVDATNAQQHASQLQKTLHVQWQGQTAATVLQATVQADDQLLQQLLCQSSKLPINGVSSAASITSARRCAIISRWTRSPPMVHPSR